MAHKGVRWWPWLGVAGVLGGGCVLDVTPVTDDVDLVAHTDVRDCPAHADWPSEVVSEAEQRVVLGDGTRTVLVYRTWDGPGGGRTARYLPAGFGLDDGVQVHCVADEDRLGYAWTHHNWEDEAWARSGEVTWRLAMVLDLEGGWTFALTTEDQNGTVIDGPHALTLREGVHNGQVGEDDRRARAGDVL